MKVKSLLRHVKGSGTIRAMKMTISVTRRRKTWKKNKSKHVGTIFELRIVDDAFLSARLHRRLLLEAGTIDCMALGKARILTRL